jgi:hypothetical protein
MKLETRIFFCFILTLILIFLTGCHSIKWESFPEAKEPRLNRFSSPLKPHTPQGITVIKGSF